MSLTSVGESSKIEKELVTIRKTGRVSVFKRIFYEGNTQNFRTKNFHSKFLGYCSIRPRFFPYDFHTCFVTGFSQIGGVHFESKYEEMVRT